MPTSPSPLDARPVNGVPRANSAREISPPDTRPPDAATLEAMARAQAACCGDAAPASPLRGFLFSLMWSALAVLAALAVTLLLAALFLGGVTL